MRCVAIDDEPLALQLTQSYAKQSGILNLVATFTDAYEAKEFLKNNLEKYFESKNFVGLSFPRRRESS